ncbi:hypothetical protein NC652_026983 [Populus alba x Populus x berolinensis]|nr:hypothetical protein NC652_026983 [Populus alba x Populus x berolinensis]
MQPKAIVSTAMDKGKANIDLQQADQLNIVAPNEPSTSAQVTPSAASAQPLLIHQAIPFPSLPIPITEPVGHQDLDDCDSSPGSGNDFLGFLGLQQHHLNDQHANLCLESKMDSLRTTSDTSSAAQGISAEASSGFITQTIPIQSPIPSPTTVKKKKGGRKKKGGQGL